VPVLDFNSGWYDLNLIKNYFMEKLAATCTEAKLASQGSKKMFVIATNFKFLNYLAPGTSYH